MHSKAGMWHHVGSTMKIVRNTLFVVGGKGEKGRLRTILLVTAIAATQEGGSPSQHHATFATVKISGFQIAQFRKRRGQTMEQRL